MSQMIDTRKYADDGFCIVRGAIDPDLLAHAESAILDLYWIQLRKIGEYREAVDSIHGDSTLTRAARLTNMIGLADITDKKALYEVQKMIASCDEVRAIYSSPAAAEACRALLPTKAPLLNAGPSLFINAPSSGRLLYRWHSEAHYYPKRRSFLNLWLPIFTDRDEANGAMSVVVRSQQLQDLPFSDYAGGAGSPLEPMNTLTQYEIPESFISGLQVVSTESEVGDLVIFNRALVHRSNANTGASTAFALVTRMWTTERDLTISGDFDVLPYVSRSGRAGLVVDY